MEKDCIILQIYWMDCKERKERGFMDTLNSQQADREAAQMQANRQELIERITRAVPEDGVIQPLEGLFLARASVARQRVHSVVKPSFCVIAQGSKEILLGGNSYRYDPAHYLIATVELPRVSQVLEASREKPYLSFRLELDPGLVSSVMMEAGQPSPAGHAEVHAMDVSPLDVICWMPSYASSGWWIPRAMRRCSCR